MTLAKASVMSMLSLPLFYRNWKASYARSCVFVHQAELGFFSEA